ncbi:hypothetical protein HYH03_004730 [Edaphochlamys debaryana]|uniref:Glycosyl transferase CAP10 domain-containing protein n=1 Tax=Edaphochlamys debaryana TaxID=47281 RepID=A0A836C2Z7_9CHLO|nr:hypothetical protein HYH03_004730 [Edaphochlamys debaryana]|eukprot:KAG2497139.1 hypothetical protein HYH03_004730 [Edaphochlamys debaryana]
MRAIWFLCSILAIVTEGLRYKVDDREAVDPNDVPVTHLPVGAVHVSEAEWAQFLEENLEPDLAPWKVKAPLRADYVWNLKDDLYKRGGPLPGVWRVVLVWKNKLYWVERDHVQSVGSAPQDASDQIKSFGIRVTRWLTRGHLQLPDVLFMINVEDNRPRWCGPKQECVVPLISLGKTMDHEGNDTDILVPQLFFGDNTFYYHPWELKKDVAYFRGVPFCSGYWWNVSDTCLVACPRTYLAWRSDLDARTNRTPSYLDVGIVEPATLPWVNDTQGELYQKMKGCQPDSIPTVPRVGMWRHARYKYLLQLEGITFSCRLSQLLMTNSLVLFQRQPFVEYFYRSLRPWVHYVPFWTAKAHSRGDWNSLDDVYGVIDGLRRREQQDPKEVHRMVAAANAFATKFTTSYGRARYLKDALTAYKDLFPDMDQYLAQFVEGLKANGTWTSTGGQEPTS